MISTETIQLCIDKPLDNWLSRSSIMELMREVVASRETVALTVWYGSMPESNGKSNWTAILHRAGECLSSGITIERSEYPERVRYEADCMRYLIGELSEEPDILTYDSKKHSGYVIAQPENLALSNFRDAMEGIGHIKRALNESFGGLHGTHVEPDVIKECKAICDAIHAAYVRTGDDHLTDTANHQFESLHAKRLSD